jgi:hypothetical protein
MGVVVRRVPADFEWPLETPWEGYLMPPELEEAPCPARHACVLGYTRARAWVQRVVELMLKLDDDRGYQTAGHPMHAYFHSVPPPAGRRVRPSADIAELGRGLAGRDLMQMSMASHDSLDIDNALEKVIAAAGLDPAVWGICPQCRGRSTVEAYDGQFTDIEQWEPTDPPTGESWQLWEDDSEGSPISPVLPTRDALIEWITVYHTAIDGGSFSRPEAAALVDAGQTWTATTDQDGRWQYGDRAPYANAEASVVDEAEQITSDAASDDTGRPDGTDHP